jgi:hypothetical protein
MSPLLGLAPIRTPPSTRDDARSGGKIAAGLEGQVMIPKCHDQIQNEKERYGDGEPGEVAIVFDTVLHHVLNAEVIPAVCPQSVDFNPGVQSIMAQ